MAAPLAELIPTWAFYAVPWLAGLAIAALALAFTPRLGPVRALGLGTMTVPVWDTLLGIVESFGPLLQGGFVLQAYTKYQLSSIYSFKFLNDLGYLGAGFLLYAGGRHFLHETPRTLARKLAEVGLPMGRRSEGASALLGAVGFPLLLLGTLGVNLVTQGLESLRQSDESNVFANMTVYHAIAISLAAAFGEELLYRGLLQTGLARLFGLRAGTAVGRGLALGGAIVAQAVVFGLAHSGYGTWIHVLLPTLFGLVTGIVAWRFGIWSTIVLHVLVDIFAFFAEVASHGADWMWSVLNALFLANVALSLGWAALGLLRWNALRHGRPA